MPSPHPLPHVYLRSLLRAFASLIVVGCVADPARAHGGFEGVGPFYGGLLHPLAVPAHLIALIAIGIFSGQRGWAFVVGGFPYLAGGTLAGLALASPAIEPAATPLLLGAAVVTGLAIALEARLPVPAAVAWVALAGALVAADSPAAPPTTAPAEAGTASVLALAGTGLGILLLFAWWALPFSRVQLAWQRIGIRVLGSWLVAGAVLSLVLAVTGRAA